MGEEKEILLRRKVCAYLTRRLMGDPWASARPWYVTHPYIGTQVRPKVRRESCRAP